MSEHKGPRSVAWEGWHATITGEKPRGTLPGFVDVQEYEADEPGRDYTMTPDEAEKHGHALIMAAAVARGEQGHTGALNRVAVALEAEAGDEADSQRRRLADAMKMEPGPWGWGQLLDTARALRVTNEGLLVERDRLRRDCDAAAEACGVAVVGHVSEAWRLLSEARDEAVAERDAAREALAASRHALGVVGGGSPVLAAWSLRHECAALRADLAAAEAVRAEAVQEAARLRVELAEAREALAGKTMHDAAADVVAPLRDALGGVLGCRPSGDPGRIIRMACDLLNSAEWPADDGRHGPKPARDPMTHHSLASIELHGVVVGDRITLASDASWARVGNIISNEGLLMSWSAAGAMRGAAFKSAVVEAPDAD